MKKGILTALSLVTGGIAGISAAGAAMNSKIVTERQYAQKHLVLMQILNQWLIDRQEGKSLVKFFEDNEYRSVAIYGMSYLGERLADELENSGIEVRYAIDKNAGNIYAGIDVKRPDDNLPEVDAIIVTPVFFFDEIEEDLEDKVDYPIISLEDVVYGV